MKLFFLYTQKISWGKLLVFIFFLAPILQGFSPKTCLADSSSIFNENKSSVVAVYTYGKDGSQTDQASGFIAGKEGVVVTNYHIISKAARIKIKFEDTMLDVKGLLYIDTDNDVVVLKTVGNDLPAIKIRDADIGPAGQKIYLLGSPGGEDKIILDGTLSRIKYVTAEKKLLLITTPVTKSCSGSPVFNEKGEVIGIATFFMDEAQPVYFAMSVSQIKSRLSFKEITPLDKARLIAAEDTAEYWFNLAAVYESLSLYTYASGAYQNALRIKPEDAIVHNKLGIIYTSLDIYSFAISEQNEAIKLKPDYQEAYYNLGIAYMKSDMIQKATEAFGKAIRLKPDDEKSYNNLAVALFKSGKLKEAVEAIKQAILIKPDDTESYYNLAAVYSQMNMYAEAIEALKRSILLKRDAPEAHLRLGIIYNMQDAASALKEYEILKNLDPDSAKVLYDIIQTKKNILSETVVSAPLKKKDLPPQIIDASVKRPAFSEEPDITEDDPGPEPNQKIGRNSKKDIYSVQLSFFNNKINAFSLSKRLKKKGYNVFIKTEYRDNQIARYRVLIGRFSDKTEALKTSNAILKKEKLKSIIFKH